MGQQIIKQPNGRFAVFSSVTDTIHVYDATAVEILEHFADRAADDARRTAGRLLDLVAADRPWEAYYQFALTWAEALALDEQHGGDLGTNWTGGQQQ